MLLKRTSQSGFTLIESAIYIALFAIIIGGGMVAAYQIIEGTDKLKTKTIIEQEANFILRKIDWAITSATSISESGSTLTVNRPSGTVTFSLNGDNFEKDGTPLNISSVKVSDVELTQTDKTTAGGVLNGVQVKFTVADLGGKISQTFTETKYAKVPR